MKKNKGVDIISLEAKDIVLGEMIDDKNGYSPRYRKGEHKGEYNLRKFINSFDYSLDLIKLREVYRKKYRNNKFSFYGNGHECTTTVINVTFKYSLGEYNQFANGFYVLVGKSVDKEELVDNVLVDNGVLCAIQLGEHVENPVGEKILGSSFYYDSEDKVYRKRKINTLYSTSELRKILYKHGFMCDGKKYVRYKRSSGSSRVGKCLFIDENLYPMMHKWEMMGIKVRKDKSVDLASLEAYIALTLSSIVDTVKIKPENILVIDDYESVFKDDVIETVYEDGELKTRDTVAEVVNSIWDGQSIMDVSLFRSEEKDYSDKGMLLLRNRFFKSCCFNGNVQKFFKEHGITDVSMLNGKTRAKNIEDVKLITTPSSIKYLKFGTLDEWLDNMEDTFGLVKYEKKTHFFGGRMVYTHYQLLNTLQLSIDDIRKLLEPSFDFVNKLKEDADVLRYYVKYPFDRFEKEGYESLLSNNEIFYKLLGINNRITETSLYDRFLKDTVAAFYKHMKRGHILVNGNYSTLCGNPIEMLMASIGRFNGESQIGIGNIHTKRFGYDMDILGSRSPHVVAGCILVHRNVENEMIDRYMNPTNEIVYINSINENILMRLSGSDFDSDTLLLTDNSILIEAAKKNYDLFKVPTCNVESSKKKRFYTAEDKLDLDIKTSKNSIGQIVNLSQELNSLFWNRFNNGTPYDEIKEIYYDACQLSVQSMLEIDSAKKEFEFSNKRELDRLRHKYCLRDEYGKVIKPYFFGFIQGFKGYKNEEKNSYTKMDTSMDYLEEAIIENARKRRRKVKKKGTKFYDLIRNDTPRGCTNYRQIEKIVDIAREYKKACSLIYANDSLEPKEKSVLYHREKENAMNTVSKMKFNDKTIDYIFRMLEMNDYKDVRGFLFSSLFAVPNKSFYDYLYRNRETLNELVEIDCDFESMDIIDIFGSKYVKLERKC